MEFRCVWFLYFNEFFLTACCGPTCVSFPAFEVWFVLDMEHMLEEMLVLNLLASLFANDHVQFSIINKAAHMRTPLQIPGARICYCAVKGKVIFMMKNLFPNRFSFYKKQGTLY